MQHAATVRRAHLRMTALLALLTALLTLICVDTAPEAASTSVAAGSRSVRPTVTPIAGGIRVSWPGKSQCRVRLSKQGSSKWHTRTTGLSPQLVTNLAPAVRYRVRLICRKGKRWLPAGRASSWLHPGAIPSGHPDAGSPRTGGPGMPAIPTADGPAAPPAPGSRPPTDAREIWVDPTAGSDAATGTESTPLRTVRAAWESIPAGRQLADPTWIQITPGSVAAGDLPNYWEHRWGTIATPIVLNAARGAHTVTFMAGVNLYDVAHVTFTGVDIISAGDPFHCELCSNVTVTEALLDGLGRPQEVVKANQSQYLQFLGNTMRGATGNVLDFVAVAHASIRGNRISGAGDWCAYVKGGSAYIEMMGNEISDCGTGGFTAGQGTGFEFMVARGCATRPMGCLSLTTSSTTRPGRGWG